MLEWKEYRSVDMVFLFVAGFIERKTGCTEEGQMTFTNSSTSILAKMLLDRDGLCGFSDQYIEEFPKGSEGVSKSLVKTFFTMFPNKK